MGVEALRRAVLGVSIVLVVLAALSAGSAFGGKRSVLHEWPQWPHSVSCGSQAFDPVRAFSNPRGAERGSRPSERALRRTLRSGWRGIGHGWRRATESRRSAEFIAGSIRGGLESISLTRTRSGWRRAEVNRDCKLVSDFAGQEAVSWKFADRETSLEERTRTLRIKVATMACRSGIKIGERARVIASRFGKRVLVVVIADPLKPGPYFCQKVDEPTLTVRLKHAVRIENVYDGATLPPLSANEIVERYPR